jgi:hypothetical protein
LFVCCVSCVCVVCSVYCVCVVCFVCVLCVCGVYCVCVVCTVYCVCVVCIVCVLCVLCVCVVCTVAEQTAKFLLLKFLSFHRMPLKTTDCIFTKKKVSCVNDTWQYNTCYTVCLSVRPSVLCMFNGWFWLNSSYLIDIAYSVLECLSVKWYLA